METVMEEVEFCTTEQRKRTTEDTRNGLDVGRK
jgi:hypothetical protein